MKTYSKKKREINEQQGVEDAVAMLVRAILDGKVRLVDHAGGGKVLIGPEGTEEVIEVQVKGFISAEAMISDIYDRMKKTIEQAVAGDSQETEKMIDHYIREYLEGRISLEEAARFSLKEAVHINTELMDIPSDDIEKAKQILQRVVDREAGAYGESFYRKLVDEFYQEPQET